MSKYTLNRGNMSIAEQVHRIRNEIAEAAVRSGRSPEDVTLVAVSKTRPIEDVAEAIDAGITHLGENRVQEAASKIPEISNDTVIWHLIGHLQSNKAKLAAQLFSWVDSVDSHKIADILNKRALAENKTLKVLIQVNISGEQSKYGITPDKVKELVRYISGCERLAVKGLLTIGSLWVSKAATREEFKRMKGLFESLKDDPEIGGTMNVLSMGMSGDYISAIEEGSTMVRVGTAIFGTRL